MSGEVDPSTRPVLERHLWPGEELVWGERPSDAGPLELRAAWRGANIWMTAGGTVLAVLLLVLLLSHVVRVPAPAVVAYGFPVLIVVVAGLGAIAGWWRARRTFPDIVYGLTTRRVIVVRKEDVAWIGAQEIEDIMRRARGLVVTRRRAEIEEAWAPDDSAQALGEAPSMQTLEELHRRQLELLSVRDPVQLERLIRETLRR